MTGGPVPGCLHIALTTAVDGEIVADRCWALGATAIGERDDTLEVGFSTDDDAQAAALALATAWPGLLVDPVDTGPALAAALAAWTPFARPQRVGALHLRPSWLPDDDDPPAAGERLVRIDPTLAFGYDHPSTLACLEQVVALTASGRSVLDIGCGSGVLAVAAAVLGAVPVVAVDIDPVAVATTARAASGNGVEVHVSARPVGEVEGTFDLVLANIGAATLVALAPAIAPRVAPEGHLVLAGLLAAQAGAVEARYVAEGLTLVATGERSGWSSPLFLRKSTTSVS